MAAGVGDKTKGTGLFFFFDDKEAGTVVFQRARHIGPREIGTWFSGPGNHGEPGLPNLPQWANLGFDVRFENSSRIRLVRGFARGRLHVADAMPSPTAAVPIADYY